MKKLAIAAAVAATFTGAAHAYTMGTFENGFVVPNAFYNNNEYTAVGVIARQAASVYWTFFDQNSNHVTDGCFTVTANDFEPFIWNAQSGGAGTAGMRGYLVFAVGGGGGTTGCRESNPTLQSGNIVNGSAFQVLPPSDVAYVPVIGGLTIPATQNLTTLNANSLTSVTGAANIGQTLYMRYFVDGNAGGNDTRIVVWSTGGQAGTHTVNMYDDRQNRKSVNFILTNDELDWFNPEDTTNLVGRPANFTDGFIEWNTSDIGTTGSIFSYSVISAPAFGAVQTILNPAH